MYLCKRERGGGVRKVLLKKRKKKGSFKSKKSLALK